MQAVLDWNCKMESQFYESIKKIQPGQNGIIVEGKIEKIEKTRLVNEPNRITIKTTFESDCMHCGEIIPEGVKAKWRKVYGAGGETWDEIRNEILHENCEKLYAKLNHETMQTCNVCDVILRDHSGIIILTLWKNDTRRFSIGDKVIIRNGYSYIFQSKLHISSGYFGTVSKTNKTWGKNHYQKQQHDQKQDSRQDHEQKQDSRQDHEQKQDYKQDHEQKQDYKQDHEQKQDSDYENNKETKSGLEKYYEILGLDSSANWKQVKAAHRRLAKKYHPDKNKSSDAESQFKKIQSAYEKLKESRDSKKGA